MERWKQVVSKGIAFPGYEVSDLGNVRSRRARRSAGYNQGTVAILVQQFHPLNLIKKKNGYFYVGLGKDGKIYQQSVAHLVLEAFVGPRPAGFDCCHGPKGSYCNELSNLCWGPKSKNHGEDRLRDGSDVRGEKQGQSKLTNADVLVIKGRLAAGETCISIAEDYGVGRTTIQAIKGGQNWWWLNSAEEEKRVCRA